MESKRKIQLITEGNLNILKEMRNTAEKNISAFPNLYDTLELEQLIKQSHQLNEEFNKYKNPNSNIQESQLEDIYRLNENIITTKNEFERILNAPIEREGGRRRSRNFRKRKIHKSHKSYLPRRKH